jgi:hypothetical protein
LDLKTGRILLQKFKKSNSYLEQGVMQQNRSLPDESYSFFQWKQRLTPQVPFPYLARRRSGQLIHDEELLGDPEREKTP